MGTIIFNTETNVIS